MVGPTNDASVVVIFGRPGAGKSTISEAAVHLLKTGAKNGIGSQKYQYQHLYLDLDVCVPQWMRENFSKGIYPTLQQRADFILNACTYVKSEINSAMISIKCLKHLITIISFSFVNTDLRTAFRDAFPNAEWILVDTHKHLAEERILVREGHFYKNSTSSDKNDSDDIEAKEAQCKGTDDNNSEWEFRPVDFPHIVLDGSNTVEVNSENVVKCIERHLEELGTAI